MIGAVVAYAATGAFVGSTVVSHYGRGCPWWSYPLGWTLNAAFWPAPVYLCVSQVCREEAE